MCPNRLLLSLFLTLAPACLAAAAETLPARVWRPVELSFTASTDIADPFDFERADFGVAFTGPGGERLDIPGFWDGDQTWKIRFTPTAPGEWTYASHFSNPAETGLHGRRGSILATPPASGATGTHLHGGLLRISKDGRYLTYSDGTPFFWLGDTWWAAPSANVPFEVFRRQVDARVSQGYTVFQAHGHRPIFEGSQTGAFEAVRKPDRETLRYWRETDRYLGYADEKGLVGVMGFARGDMFDPFSLGELQRLWRYYLARYGAYAISILITQEYNIDPDKRRDHLPKLLAIGRFIKSSDPYQRAMTAHPWCRSRDERQAWDEPWLDFIMLQAGHRHFESAKAYLELWQRSPVKPFLESEANYEGFLSPEFHADADAIRRSAYTAIQSGSFGFTYGAQGLYAGVLHHAKPGPTARWGPVLTWEEGLALPGGTQLRHLRACYEAVDWWRLRPLPDAVEPATVAVLVKAEPPETYLVYFVASAKVRPISRLKSLAPRADFTASWFDPRNGQRRESGRVEASTEGMLDLPPARDSQDWLLLLRRLAR